MYQFAQDANSILVQHKPGLMNMERLIDQRLRFFFSLVWLFSLVLPAKAALPELINELKPSVVALAIYSPSAAPRLKLLGSGFVAPPGNLIVTNHHVVAVKPDTEKNETYVVLSGHGQQPKVHQILNQRLDRTHDLAVLEIAETLPAVKLAPPGYVAEGTALAFTGYPITGVLGLYPATHAALLSAVTPIAIPAENSQVISATTLRQLREPFFIYQLDGTAYPGNSGSMLYRQDTGEVVGVINMVLVKSSREAILSDPSGISYAIPIKHLHHLLSQVPNGNMQ